jgi:hypothetical protein
MTGLVTRISRGLVLAGFGLGLLSDVGLSVASASPATRLPHIGSFDVPVLGLSATVDPLEPTIPKNIASAVRIVVKAGDVVLSAEELVSYVGDGFQVRAELSGPGLGATITLPDLGPSDPPPADPLLLPIPALPIAGDYSLSNIRLIRGGQAVLDVSPASIPIRIIDQVLVTSVQTRPLTLEEIRDKGIVLDSDDYLAFEFTIGLAANSQSVSFSMPVVFDRAGVPVPQVIEPPPAPPAIGISAPGLEPPQPLIIPAMLDFDPVEIQGVPEVNLRLPGGEPIRIPSVLVIPGNVGYLKQFFSAQLFVANGAPVGSGLTVRDVTGTVKLPAGADFELGTADDPLSLPETVRGPQPATMAVKGVGLDGEAGTADDALELRPGQQGQAEFLIRGEQEGFHALSFDVDGTLDGLPIGAVGIKGKASGGVLVRNPFFDVTFTTPSVVRKGEPFSIFATVTNIGQGIANDVTVTFDASRMSGARAVGGPVSNIDTLRGGDAKTLEYKFVSERTGQVQATYLHFDANAAGSGNLKFTLGVGERGVPLSPDTLVLPASVGGLPGGVVDAAMRVLGQAWSIANAPTGRLPSGVTRVSRAIATEKALALAEAGLRVELGQDAASAVRDLAFDFFGGEKLDPGFDQLLRQTAAGHDFARVVGTALRPTHEAAGGTLAYASSIDSVAVSGPDYLRIGIGSGNGPAPVAATLIDAGNRRSVAPSGPEQIPTSEIPAGGWLPLGPSGSEPLVGLFAFVTSPSYTLDLVGTGAGSVDLSVTIPRGGGRFTRGTLSGVAVTEAARVRLVMDLRHPESLALEVDPEGDGSFDSTTALATTVLEATGPELISASVVGPETIDGASPFGLHAALLFDRVVDPTSSSNRSSYSIPKNAVQSAKSQLSGRLVFASLDQPEGPYVPTTFSSDGVRDQRGARGPPRTVPLQSRLTDPGAVVSGRVIGPDGTPASSGAVTYVNNSNWQCLADVFQANPSAKQTGFAAVPLDATGRYEFRYVRQDQCGLPWLMSTKDPRTQAARSVSGYVQTAGEQIVLDIALLGQGSVGGTVRDLSNNVVPGAQVTVVSQTDPQVGGTAVTDGDGRYEVTGITVGAVTVSAAKGSGVGTTSGNIARAGGTAVVDVTIDSGAAAVRGLVMVEEGTAARPAAGALVTFESNGVVVAVTHTDLGGRYQFDAVPVGPFKVLAALNSRDRAQATGTLAAGETRTNFDLVIVLPDPNGTGTGGNSGLGFGKLLGTVLLPDGSAAPGAIVSIGNRGVLSGEDGSFEITGVPVQPGQAQTVSARSRDGLRAGSAVAFVNQANQVVEGVVVVLSGLGSAEFLVLGPTGAPVAGQVVGLLDRCETDCGCNPRTSDVNGKVFYDNLPIGSVHAHAVRPGTSFVDVADGTASITRDGETAHGTLRFNGSGVVSGVVRNGDGQLVFGADVVLYSVLYNGESCSLGSGISQRIRTDSLGRYRFQAVNLGALSVTASQVFFPTPATRSGVLTSNGQELALDLTLSAAADIIAGELSGTVFLPDGVTPAGAGVEITASGQIPDVVVTTNAAGRFRFAKIFPEGSYILTARDPITGGVARSGVHLRASQDLSNDIRLLGRGTVRVRVADASDAPVAKAFVRLRETSFPNRDFEAAIEGANQGVATFEGVFEGPVSAEATDVTGRGGRASGVLAQPGATLDMKVTLSITGRVAGVFVEPDGTTPIPFGSVTLRAGGRVLGQTTTQGSGAETGRFVFENVPAGPFQVDAQDPATARTGFAVGTIASQDQTAEVTIRAQGLGVVEGLVTSNGQPQPGADVTLVAGGRRANTMSDASGRYRITGIPEGPVSVTASLGEGYLSGSASGNLSGDGTTLELDVALHDSGDVVGQVVRADGETPATTSLVSLQVGGSGGESFSTLTDATGHFKFERLPSGTASLFVDVLGGIDQASDTVEIPAGGTVDVEIVLHGVGSIRGTARDSAGAPTAGTVVISGTGSLPYSRTLAVGTDGQFAIPEVLAGPVAVALTVQTGTFTLYGAATGNVLPDQEAVVDVQVQPTGIVRGRVLRANGTTPALGTEVMLRLLPNRGLLVFNAGNDGRFETRGVPLGSFELQLRDPVSGGLGLVQGRDVGANGQIVDVGDVVLDNEPVEAVGFDPPDGSLDVPVNQPIVVLFSDRLASPSGVQISNDTSTLSASATLSSDRLSVTLTGTWTDSSEIFVTATTSVTDIFGRHPRQARSVKFHTTDLSPPRVAAVSPADQAIEVPAGTVVGVTFDESLGAGTDLSSLVILSSLAGSIPGTTLQTGPARVEFLPSVPLSENATFTVSVNGAVDASGNRQTAPFNSSFRTHDSQPPLLALTAPDASAWLPTARPSIVVSLSDGLSGIDAASGSLSLDAVGVTPNRSPSALSYTPPSALAEGAHELLASVRDRAGNLGTLTETLRIDTLPPDAPVLSGIASGDVLIGNVPVAASAADAGSGVDKVQVFVDGLLLRELNAPHFAGNLSSATLSDGAHVVTARAVDRAANVSVPSSALNVVVDNVPLTVSITAPAPGAQFRESVGVSATTSEPVTQVSFTVGGEPVADATAPFSATLSLGSLPEGSATITVTATGLLGEHAEISREISVDRTPPAPPVVALIAAEPPDGGSSFVHGESGAVEGGALVTARNTNPSRPGTGLATAGTAGSFALQLAAAVGDVLALTATDRAGNVSEPVNVTVRSTTTLPPEPATVRFDGIAIDRVSLTSLSPDGARDAIFAVQFSMPATTTRQLAFVELQGPVTLSTRPGSAGPLAVSGPDLGSPLLNDANGEVSAPVTGSGSFLLYAPGAGFIEANTSYRVTMAFTNGSRFIGVAAIGALPREEVASGILSVQNQYVPIPGGGGGEPEPGGGDPLQMTDVSSVAFSLFNRYFQKNDVVNTPGGGQPTDVSSMAFSIANDRLPYQDVLSAPGGGQPTEVAGLLVSIRNQQLPFASWTGVPGGLQPNDVNGPVFSFFNSKLPFENLTSVPGGLQPTEVGSAAVSINNDPNAVVGALSALLGSAFVAEAARIFAPAVALDTGPAIALSVADVSVSEADGFAHVNAHLSSPSSKTVSVEYALERDSITPESEYEVFSGTLVFAPGVVSQSISIPVFDDTLSEGDEGFWVTFTSPKGATLTAERALVSVRDDDLHPAPRAELFDDFEAASLDGRWHEGGERRINRGLLELAGSELRMALGFGHEPGGVSLSARVRFSGPAERIGFAPEGPAAGGVSYYFETSGSSSDQLEVRAVAEFAVEGDEPARLLDEPLELDVRRFSDLRIDRTPDAVVFSVDGVEVASTSYSTEGELEVAALKGDEDSGPRLDWVQVVSSGAQELECVPLPADVRAWWPGDGDTRERVGGLSSPISARFARGRVGQAFAFETLSHALPALDTAQLTPQAFTLALWVEPASPSGVSRHLIAKPEPASSQWSFVLELDADNRLAFAVWDGTRATRISTPEPLSSGVLHHVAATRQGNELLLFVDGEPDVSGEFPGVVAYNAGSGADLVLGFEPDAAGQLVPELLDEITVHDRALAPDEIFDLYQAGNAGYCLP